MSTRQQIEDFALGMFLKYGIKSVTMDDLANAMGISKKTLYQYVSNKEDLVHSVIKKLRTEDMNKMAGVIDASSNAIDSVMKVAQEAAEKLEMVSPIAVYDLKKYHQSIWQEVEKKEVEFIFSFIEKNINRGIAEGLYRADIDQEFVKRLHTGIAFSAIDERLFPRNMYSKSLLLKEMMYHFLLGIVTDKGYEFLQTYRNTKPQVGE